MVSAGEYVAGVIELAIVIGPLGLAAVRLRARFLAGWEGAPARLAEAVLGLSMLIWVGEILGLVGLLEEAPLVIACAAVGGSVAYRARPAGGRADRPPVPPVAPLAALVTLGVVAVLFAHWGIFVKQALNNGVNNFDSLWYHLPFAADMAQSGSVTGFHYTDTIFLNWFYPQNSELLHATGMVLTGRDTLSLFINLGWLALTLLAAWCVGRPWGRGPHAVAAVALVLESHTLIFREPGAAKNDVMAAALVLAAAALLITAWTQTRATSNEERGTSFAPLAVAGLAAGLAVGTKLTVLATIAALTVAVILLAGPGRRRRAALFWLGPMLATGGLWYARNLVGAGNPIPQIRRLGPIALPAPERLQEARPDFPIVHYATDTSIWHDYFGPGLHDAFGSLWPIVLAAALAGALLALARRSEPLLRALGAVSLFGIVAYLATPLSAAGQEGMPIAFAINIRFVLPPLILGLALLPLGRWLDGERAGWLLLGALLLVLAITDRSDSVLREPERAFGVLVVALAVLVPAALLGAHRLGRLSAAATATGFVALFVAVAAIGYPVQRDYLHSRWRDFDPDQHLDSAYRWARDVHDSRIGLAGTTIGSLSYGLYGADLSNRVQYLGRKGPHGAFNAIRTCAGFRSAVNDADLDYLITSPFLNFAHTSRPILSPEAGWIRGDPAVSPLIRDGAGKAQVTVWRIEGRLDPAACGPLRVPTTYLPRAQG